MSDFAAARKAIEDMCRHLRDGDAALALKVGQVWQRSDLLFNGTREADFPPSLRVPHDTKTNRWLSGRPV